MSRILQSIGDRYQVRTVSPLAPHVLEAYKHGARGASCAFYESDSLTLACADKDTGLLLATTAGSSHASVLTRLLAAQADAPSDLEVVSAPSVQTDLDIAKQPGLILNGWLKRHERLQNHG